jgi:hypothetical protein
MCETGEIDFPQPKPVKRLRQEEDEQEAKRRKEEEEEVAEEEEEEEDQKAALDRLLDEAEQVGVMDLQQVSRFFNFTCAYEQIHACMSKIPSSSGIGMVKMCLQSPHNVSHTPRS